jgi:hypothetical protein
MEQHTFGRVPVVICSAFAMVHTQYPTLHVMDLMAAMISPVKYSLMKLSPMGACLDMLCFRSCLEPGCTYKHSTMWFIINPSSAVSKLKVAYTV